MIAINDAEPVVLLPVLLRHAPEVAAYAATLLTGADAVELPLAVPDAIDQLSVVTGYDSTWTTERLEKLSASTYLTVQRFAKALDELSKVPEDKLYTPVLAEKAGMERSEFHHATTKMTAHLAVHYDGVTWPIRAKWDQEKQQTYYWTTPAVAERWRAIRAT